MKSKIEEILKKHTDSIVSGDFSHQKAHAQNVWGILKHINFMNAKNEIFVSYSNFMVI